MCGFVIASVGGKLRTSLGASGIAPGDCIVIEDSVGGVTAGRAAGATVIGLTAASHIQPGFDVKLREAGADHVVASFAELDRVIRPLLGVDS